MFDLAESEKHPSGLKPVPYSAAIGTTKVVPFQNRPEFEFFRNLFNRCDCFSSECANHLPCPILSTVSPSKGWETTHPTSHREFPISFASSVHYTESNRQDSCLTAHHAPFPPHLRTAFPASSCSAACGRFQLCRSTARARAVGDAGKGACGRHLNRRGPLL